MNRKDYTAPEMMIKMFAEDEIITASMLTATRDPDAPIELPMVPAQ